MTLRCERIGRVIDQAPCDNCARLIEVGELAAVHLESGLIFCGRDCALKFGRDEMAAEAGEQVAPYGWENVG